MNHVHRAIVQQLVETQLGLFEGSDFTTLESLEKSEYFRGQVELIADMLGGCDAKDALWEPLKSACAASARGEPLVAARVQEILAVAERHLRESGAE